MFYSADGNFIYKNKFYKNKIYENFEPSQLLKINEYKDNIRYSSLEFDVQKKIDSLIDFVVQEANNTVKEYSEIESGIAFAKKRQVHDDLKTRKNTNNIIRVLERMTLYNGGEEFLDGLYRNQLSLFNNIVQIEGWKEAGSALEKNKLNPTCSSLKSELTTHFDNYNKGKQEKNQADANIIAIEKQKIAAQEIKNIAIININKTATGYNNTLIKLHQNMCG
jgi:hypothetical protein